MMRSPFESALTVKGPADGVAEGAAALQLADLSRRSRFGCKGPGAGEWLATAGFPVPHAPNSAVVDAGGIFVARLATSEFLVEALEDRGAARVQSQWQLLSSSSCPSEVYPVVRQDGVVGVRGTGLQTLLRQICSVDFVPLLTAGGSDSGPIVLASMVGVGVVAWPSIDRSGSTLTLWLDPSFAHYFWVTLLEVGRGVGITVIGSDT